METHGKCNDYPIGVQPNGWKRTNNLKNFERGNSVVRNYKRVEFSEIKCKYSQCNKIFLPKSKINIYCSLKCSRSDKKYKHICTNCGKSFETNKRSVYCCSDECRKNRKQSKRNIPKMVKITLVNYCDECGKEYHTTSKAQRFCSYKCKTRNRNKLNELERRKYYDAGDSSITLTKLIDKENNICSICSKPCDSNDYEIDDNGSAEREPGK